MTNQPHPIPPPFRPVPALPIRVLPAPKGVRVLATAAAECSKPAKSAEQADGG